MLAQESEDAPPGVLRRDLDIALLVGIHEGVAGVLVDVEVGLDAETPGNGTISEYNGLIVVTQTAQTHNKIERVLDMLREAAGLESPKTGKVVR